MTGVEVESSGPVTRDGGHSSGQGREKVRGQFNIIGGLNLSEDSLYYQNLPSDIILFHILSYWFAVPYGFNNI